MINVCYGGNKKIFDGLLLSVMSLAKYSEEEIRVYVLTMNLTFDNPRFEDFSDEQMNILNKVLKEKNPKSEAIKVDMTELYIKHLMKGKNHQTGYTPYTLLRLLADYVPDMPDKMIYLDIDTMACSDIKQLYDVNVDDFDFGAAKDYMGRFWIRPNYCNAGVLIMNMKRIKESGLFEKCRKLVFDKKLLLSDQTALNKYGKIKRLPFKFNEQRKIKSDTVVKHFCKGIVFFLPFGFHIYNIKQWQREDVHKRLKIFQFDDIFEEFDKLKKENNI